MCLSAPRYDSLDSVTLRPVKKLIGINPLRLSATWTDYIDILALNPVNKILGINPMGHSNP